MSIEANHNPGPGPVRFDDGNQAGPAATSGVRPGDLLTSADRQPLRSRHDLEVALVKARGRRRGVALEITRGTDPVRVALPPPAGLAEQQMA